ncbi:MAG TPA: CPBP family intramembrane glutamic endopeptidase [Actinomycetota bacterium]
MTAPAIRFVVRPAIRSWGPAAIAVLGCLALLARQLTAGSMVATAAVGVAGLVAWPRARVERRPLRWIVVTSAGMAAFALSLAFGPLAEAPATALGVAAVTLAAVSEELFFRRLTFGWVEGRWGAAHAVVVTAALFAIVHVPMYGVAVLPLDLAAGFVFGWQRWASGGWTAPLVTHVAVNLVHLGWWS